jgi:hypothetical protein
MIEMMFGSVVSLQRHRSISNLEELQYVPLSLRSHKVHRKPLSWFFPEGTNEDCARRSGNGHGCGCRFNYGRTNGEGYYILPNGSFHRENESVQVLKLRTRKINNDEHIFW